MTNAQLILARAAGAALRDTQTIAERRRLVKLIDAVESHLSVIESATFDRDGFRRHAKGVEDSAGR